MIGVQVISGSEFWDLSKFLGFLISSVSQVYYICLYGSLLLDYSGKIGEEMMSQEWYLADNRYQRMLILAIARSQRPAHLTAYKFFMISMESFANDFHSTPYLIDVQVTHDKKTLTLPCGSTLLVRFIKMSKTTMAICSVLDSVMVLVVGKVAKKLANGYRVLISNGNNDAQFVYRLQLHFLGGDQMKWPPSQRHKSGICTSRACEQSNVTSSKKPSIIWLFMCEITRFEGGKTIAWKYYTRLSKNALLKLSKWSGEPTYSSLASTIRQIIGTSCVCVNMSLKTAG
ncbi:hypothetical protein GQX74_014808 [Glossina fuscipes]|nr:hypothetical protein GQX74_014808 [Glossina fuscipes]